MKIDVILNGERKDIDLKGIKGRDSDKLLKQLMELQGADEKELTLKYSEYQDHQKKLACEISGLSVEQLDELEVDDRSKILDYINDKMQKSMGFSKLLQK